MPSAESTRITGLLKAWAEGDASAQERLIPLVYDELRRLARYYRKGAGAGDTLQTTALVHEAYVRLVGIEQQIDWNSRVHFYAVSAQLMRRILVDSARAHHAAKRGGGFERVDPAILDLDRIPSPESGRGAELTALDAALTALACTNQRLARVIELRVFVGLTVEETAEAMGLSPQSVMRDWKLGKAWLLCELSNPAPHEA